MPNRDSEKLITDGYTTTLLGDELMVCENMKHIRVTSVPSYTEVGMIILCLRGTAKICIFEWVQSFFSSFLCLHEKPLLV